MQQFRSFVRGPVGVALLVLFTIPFIITGFYGYFTGNPSGSAVANVDGVDIPAQVLDSRVQQMRLQMRQQSPQIDPSMIDSFIQPSMVLSGLINNQLMTGEAKNTKMLVSVEQAGRLVVKAPQFQKDGKYDRAAFQEFVAQRGMTESGFLSSLQGDILMNQVRAGIADTDFSLPVELAEQRRLAEQQRDIRFVQKRADKLAESFDVTDEDVSAYYDAHADSYMRPEQFKLSYVELSSASVDDGINVSDADVELEYQARLGALQAVAANSERRKMAHIEIKLGDTRSDQEAQTLVSDIKARLDAGEDFAKVAADTSEDTATAKSGGELGTFTRDELPENMAQVLFSMNKGDVSEAIEVDGNIHILKLQDVVKRELPTLADLSDSIRNDLKRAQIDARIAEKAARLDELAFEHGDLQTLSEELNLPIQQTDWSSLSAPTGFASNGKVLEALNSPSVKKDGHNSALLELGENRYSVVNLAETRPAEPIPVEQVRDSIVASVRLQRAADQLDALAEALREKLVDGGGFDDAAGELGGTVEEMQNLTRNSQDPTLEIVREVFSLARPQADSTGTTRVMRLANGDVVVVELLAVRDGAVDALSSEQQAMALAELASVEGERSLRQAIGYMRDSADVTINDARLNALSGAQAQ